MKLKIIITIMPNSTPISKNQPKPNLLFLLLLCIGIFQISHTSDSQSPDNSSNPGVFINDSDYSTDDQEPEQDLPSPEEDLPKPSDVPDDDPILKKKTGTSNSLKKLIKRTRIGQFHP